MTVRSSGYPHTAVRVWKATGPLGRLKPMTISTPLALLLTTLVFFSAPTALFSTSPAAGSPGKTHWSWPLSPKPGLQRAFDPPDKPWLSGHRGVDLGPSFDGAQVTSPADGVVTFSGTVVDRPVLTIDHGGLKSSFEPVASTLKPGDPVNKGQPIGTLEPGHCGTITCLHWGVRQDGTYINPLDLVQDMRPSVLLPLG